MITVTKAVSGHQTGHLPNNSQASSTPPAVGLPSKPSKAKQPIPLPAMAIAKLSKGSDPGKVAGFEPLLSLQHVCKILGYSASTVRRRVAEGQMIPVQSHKGAQLRFTPAELRRYVAMITGQNI